jgi:hypothetical protein
LAEIRHFAIKKSPKQHGKGNFFFLKLSTFRGRDYEIAKILKILEDLSRVLAFFF